MGYHWRVSNRFYFFHFSKLTHSIGLIMENAEYQLMLLLNRLDEAEGRAKLIKLEVKNIQQEITLLRNNILNGIEGAQGPLRKIRRSILLDSPPSSSLTTSDVLPSKNRKLDDTDSNDVKESNINFTIENDYVIVYTDGACENNGKQNAKAGIGVWFGDDHPLNVSKPVNGRPTNNTAEIQACVEALRVAKKYGIKKVMIHTDSEFTINCMTQWIHNWKKNDWKTKAGTPVKNKEDLIKLDNIMKTFKHIQWIHVCGHIGVKGNEQADRLARLGANLYSK